MLIYSSVFETAKSAAFAAADFAIIKRKGKMKMKKLLIDSNYNDEL